jgi:RNA polymerase sigma-70 factor, ECF subfamily
VRQSTGVDPLDIDAAYAEHGELVARTIERLIGPGPQVDDLLQECFIVAWRRRGEYDAKRAAVSSWLYGIAVNLCRTHRRSRRRWWVLSDRLRAEPLSSTPAEAPDAAAERGQAVRLVTEAMEGLPAKQREVLALFELEGLEGEQIAALVGVPVGTVWTRLHHARKTFEKRLRRRLGVEVTS